MNKLDIVDKPSKRRAHLRNTPRGGGIGLVIIFSILLPIFEYYNFKSVKNSENLLQIFLPIALVSFWDDIRHVIIPLRLFIHMLCSCLAIMWIIHPDTLLHTEIPINLDLALGTFALLTFLNIYNFLDGVDGITSMQSIHLSCTILILCIMRRDTIPNVDFIIIIVTTILGWSLGFIFFNWQPAKIFIGDIGSISLGFLLGICLLKIATESERLFAACVISALYYIADGGLTILIRSVRGEKIWQPHLKHFFQQAVRRGESHKEVVIRIMKCNFLLMLLAINSLYYPVVSIIIAILVVMITLIKSIT